MEYRRAKIPGGTYFFTLVTHQRRRFLCQPDNISLLRQTFRLVMENHPFTIEAIVILPDHLHCIWTLPPSDANFSTRWRLIKSHFSRNCDSRYHGCLSASRQSKQERAIWQRRFWEHLIRDEADFIQHVDYIHYNPVKHGLVTAPQAWPHSSFHRFVQAGQYDEDWGAGVEIKFAPTIDNE
ncbi:MAG: transposase [Anaerolineae bacterium]|nr:transposase [Anaerolineae bacterium]